MMPQGPGRTRAGAGPEGPGAECEVAVKMLSLTQPWASAIPLGLKTWETRSWWTGYRGPVGIHAAKGFPKWAKEFAETERALGRGLPRIPLGAVVAVAYIADCIPTEDALLVTSAIERLYGDYSEGRWAWKLTAVQPLATPIPAKGALGLWTPGPELERAILEQLPSEPAPAPRRQGPAGLL